MLSKKESTNKVDQVLLTNSFRINMEPEKFRITLCYLNGDMHIPNNKNIIFLLDSRKRKFKTSKNNRWKFSNRVDTMNLRLFPREVYRMLITINMKSDIAFVPINNSPYSIKKRSSKSNRHTIVLGNIKNNKVR